MGKLKKVSFMMLFIILPMLLLSSCSGDTENPIDLSVIGSSFVWFFTKFTPTYFGVFGNVWEIMSSAVGIWGMSSVLTFIVGVVITVFIFILVVLIYLILIIGYVIAFVGFILVYIIGVIITIICFIVLGILMFLFFF